MAVDKDAAIGGNLTVAGKTQTDVLHFSNSHIEGDSCSTSLALSRDRDGQLLQCHKERWRLLIQGSDARYIQFGAPAGIFKALTKYYFPMGHWMYCRDYAGTSILWAEGNLWGSSVFGNSGNHTVVCYGKLSP